MARVTYTLLNDFDKLATDLRLIEQGFGESRLLIFKALLLVASTSAPSTILSGSPFLQLQSG